MEIYTIADETNECYGHGDFGSELRICHQGGYGTGEFPPVFKSRKAAEKYLNGIKWNCNKKIVTLNLRDEV